MHKKTFGLILTVILLSVEPLLMGSGLFKVELRNTDEKKDPLVKINELIGGSHMSDASKTPKAEEAQAAEKIPEKTSETAVETEQEPEDTTITVRIEEKMIYLNGSKVDAEKFEERFENIYDGSQHVILEDAFAEYHTYEKVKDFFEKNHISYEEKSL